MFKNEFFRLEAQYLPKEFQENITYMKDKIGKKFGSQ